MKDTIPCPLENGTKTYWDDIQKTCTTEEYKTCILHNVGETPKDDGHAGNSLLIIIFFVTLKALKYSCINYGEQYVFSI